MGYRVVCIRIVVPVFVLTALWFLAGFFDSAAPIAHMRNSTNAIALTFDDGPAADTPAILNILQRYHVNATFFVLGEKARHFPSIVKWESREGHEVENHSWSHPHFIFHGSRFLKSEIQSTSELIEDLTGEKPRFFRPPYGQVHLPMLRAIHSLGLSTVMWSVTGYDWFTPGADRIESNVVNGLKPGAIILLHDGGGDRSQTVMALPRIIEAARARGYHFVRLRD